MIKDSFRCGLILFAINMLIAVVRLTPLFMITAFVLPGFLYGIILTRHAPEEVSTKRSTLVIVLSGILYMVASYIATGLLRGYAHASFIAAAIIGAVLLLLIHQYFLHARIITLKGIILSVMVALVACIIPFLERSIRLSGQRDWITATCVFSVFPVWQTLFGWLIIKVESYQLRNYS